MELTSFCTLETPVSFEKKEKTGVLRAANVQNLAQPAHCVTSVNSMLCLSQLPIAVGKSQLVRLCPHCDDNDQVCEEDSAVSINVKSQTTHLKSLLILSKNRSLWHSSHQLFRHLRWHRHQSLFVNPASRPLRRDSRATALAPTSLIMWILLLPGNHAGAVVLIGRSLIFYVVV